MVESIIPMPYAAEWCEHCHKLCVGIRKAYLLKSDNPNQKDMVICNACIDIAATENNIIPEEF